MFPNFSSFPNFPNQIQPNPTNIPITDPQGVPSNPNNVQIQPQMGMFPQTPGTNSNIPMSGVLTPGFMNGPNSLLKFPLGMQQLGQLARPLCNLGQNGYLMNSFQQNPQLFQQNLLQQFGNMNAVLAPNFNFALQNLNHLLQGSSVFNQYNGVQDLLLLANSQIGMLQQMNQAQNLVQQAGGVDGLRSPDGLPQQPGETSVNPITQHQSNNPVRPQKFRNTQDEYNVGRITTPTTHSKNFQRKGFHKSPRGYASQMGSRKPHFQHMKNGKRKFEFNNRDERTVNGREPKGNDQPKECKRSLMITYTEQEIQQWREERRRNYPSKVNIQKKHESETSDADANVRREQLKDILAKQAELGVEVAEIPSHYLQDSENKVQVREQNKSPFNKKQRFQNKNDKRKRRNGREWFNKKRGFGDDSSKKRLGDEASSNVPPFSKNKPTLLQKLLSKDIKRDKCHLLQAFRFMVMNSFFEHTPDQPLKFPSVIIKDTGCDGEVIEEKASFDTKDVLGGDKKDLIDSEDDDDEDSDNGDGENMVSNNVCTDIDLQLSCVGKASYAGKDSCGPQVEEGEIID